MSVGQKIIPFICRAPAVLGFVAGVVCTLILAPKILPMLLSAILWVLFLNGLYHFIMAVVRFPSRMIRRFISLNKADLRIQ